MTNGTFGESLKREREMRGVTLDEISVATRISIRFLKAIENEAWEQLPGGVFNRGFVRAVARYLGLDEENTVAEYTLAVGDRQTVPVWTGRPPAVAPDQLWIVWVVTAAIVFALLAGGWIGARRFLARRAAKRAALAAAMSFPPPSDALRAPGSSSGAATEPNPLDTPSGMPGDLFELQIATARKTRVTIVVDKDVVFDETMKAGENHKFSATDHFQVSADDAGALHLELNGKALPPMGTAGHYGKITLTRNDLKGTFNGGT